MLKAGWSSVVYVGYWLLIQTGDLLGLKVQRLLQSIVSTVNQFSKWCESVKQTFTLVFSIL